MPHQKCSAFCYRRRFSHQIPSKTIPLKFLYRWSFSAKCPRFFTDDFPRDIPLKFFWPLKFFIEKCKCLRPFSRWLRNSSTVYILFLQPLKLSWDLWSFYETFDRFLNLWSFPPKRWKVFETFEVFLKPLKIFWDTWRFFETSTVKKNFNGFLRKTSTVKNTPTGNTFSEKLPRLTKYFKGYHFFWKKAFHG